MILLLATALMAQLSLLVLPVKQVFRHRALKHMSRNEQDQAEVLTLSADEFKSLKPEEIGEGMLEIEWKGRKYDVFSVTRSADGKTVYLTAEYDGGETHLEALIHKMMSGPGKGKANPGPFFSFYYWQNSQATTTLYPAKQGPETAEPILLYQAPPHLILTPPPELQAA